MNRLCAFCTRQVPRDHRPDACPECLADLRADVRRSAWRPWLTVKEYLWLP